MATQLQLRRGTTTETDAYTGAVGEVIVNTTKDTLVVQDGATQGGHELAKTNAPSFTGGIDVTGNVSLPDNGKVTFGDGDDLVIYHHSSNNASYIQETGAGNLMILGDNTKLMNAAGTENKIDATSDGAVTLYYDNTSKIATTSTGIDVTGTATMDGLTVDGSPVLAASINNSSATAGTGGLKVNTASVSSSTIPFYVRSNDLNRLRVKGNGDFELFEDTGTTPKFAWDAAAESLGIGTSSPQKPLHVNSGIGNIGVRVESSDATSSIEFIDSGTTSTSLSPRIGGISDDFFVQTSGTARMRIDSAGNASFNTTNISPSANNVFGTALLQYGGASMSRTNSTTLDLNRSGSDGAIIQFRKNGEPVGSIGNYIAYMYMGSTGGSVDTHIAFVNGAVRPATATGTQLDNTLDLGSSGARFKDLYLSGGVYLGGTSGANELDDYEQGNWTPAYTAASGSVTMGSVSGSYTKVGNLVTLYGKIEGKRNTASGIITITGLPFASVTDSGTMSIGLKQNFLGDRPDLVGRTSLSSISLRANPTNATGQYSLSATDLRDTATTDNTLTFTVTYKTNA